MYGAFVEDTMTINEYIKAKTDMLTDEFGFNLDIADIFKLQSAKNEIQCDQIAHTLFNKYM